MEEPFYQRTGYPFWQTYSEKHTGFKSAPTESSTVFQVYGSFSAAVPRYESAHEPSSRLYYDNAPARGVGADTRADAPAAGGSEAVEAMMKKMGYVPGKGLGRGNQGPARFEPIPMQSHRHGVAFKKPPKVGLLKCTVCDKAAIDLAQLKDHVASVKHERAIQRALNTKRRRTTFDRDYALPTDSDRASSSPVISYECNVCGVSLPSVSSVEQHLAQIKHSAVKPSTGVVCEPCNLSLNSKQQLDQHINSARHRSTLARRGATRWPDDGKSASDPSPPPPPPPAASDDAAADADLSAYGYRLASTWNDPHVMQPPPARPLATTTPAPASVAAAASSDVLAAPSAVNSAPPLPGPSPGAARPATEDPVPDAAPMETSPTSPTSRPWSARGDTTPDYTQPYDLYLLPLGDGAYVDDDAYLDDAAGDPEFRLGPPPASDDESPPPPPPADQDATLPPITDPAVGCSLCNVRYSSEANMHAHRNGRRHRAAVSREFRVLPPTAAATSAPAVDRSGSSAAAAQAAPPSLYCPVCSLEFTSAARSADHFAGRRHRAQTARVAQAPGIAAAGGRPPDVPSSTAPPPPSPAPAKASTPPIASASLDCKLCGVSFTSPAMEQAHLRGKKHQKAVDTLRKSALDNMMASSYVAPALKRKSELLTKSAISFVSGGTAGPADPPPAEPAADAASESESADSDADRCALCAVVYTSAAARADHLAGKKHKKTLANARSAI